jgi:hypothetical protein
MLTLPAIFAKLERLSLTTAISIPNTFPANFVLSVVRTSTKPSVPFATPANFRTAVNLLTQSAMLVHRVNSLLTKHNTKKNTSIVQFAKNLVTNTFPKQNHALFVEEVATKTNYWMTFNAKNAHPTNSLRMMPRIKITTIRLTTA